MPTPQSEKSEHHMLILHDGSGRRVVQLEDVAYSVGRDSSNAIVLDGPSISRQHALLVRLPVPNLGYRYRVLDGNSEGKPSANGVFINGERRSMHELTKGDIIRFGKEIKATYMTVAMEQVEFLHYMEELSYQSLKSDVTDAKATMVSPEFLAGNPAMAVAGSSGPAQNHGFDSNNPKLMKETVRLPRPGKKTFLGKLPIRLWMVGLGAISSLTAGALWLVLKSPGSAPNPTGATAAPSSEVSPE